MFHLNDPALIGDTAHAFCILQTCLFAILAVTQSSNFDSVWMKDGFCVSNKDVAYMTSHDLCFYLDILGAILCGYLYNLFKPVKGMEGTNALFKNNIGGIASHGFAHFLIAESMRGGEKIISLEDRLDVIANYSFQQFVIQIGGIVVFWLTLLKASMANVGWERIIPLAIIATVGNLQIPPQFGFTYVQTILLLAFSFNQLNRQKEEKTTRAYALYPLLVSLPLNMIAWMESTMCSSFIIYVGGHLMYDGAIVVSLVVYYYVCFWDLLQQNLKKMTNESI